MVDLQRFSAMALGFDEAVEQPHFHKTSFRVRKKVFATLDIETEIAVLKLAPQEQATFIDLGQGAITSVKGAWCQQGWTEINLKDMAEDLLAYALKTAYCRVAPKTLAKTYLSEPDQ